MNLRQAGRIGAFLILGALLVLGLSSCGAPHSAWKDVEGGGKNVLVSFPPLYCFAKTVAGPDAKVLSLLTTVGPHDYEPTTADAVKVRDADLFLINGLELDETLIKLASSSGNSKLDVIHVGEAVPKKELLALEEEKHDKKAEDAHGHHHEGEYDPHVWLGLPEAVHMVNRIRDALIKIDPAHQDGYTHRAADYVKELEDLRQYGRKALAAKKNRKLIATHDSLRYFARSFEPEAKIEIVGNIQVRAGVPPDAAQMKALAALVKKDDVRVLAVEPQYVQARTEAEALVREIGPQGKGMEIVEIDPIETVPDVAALNAATYMQRMKTNIEALAKALQ